MFMSQNFIKTLFLVVMTGVTLFLYAHEVTRVFSFIPLAGIILIAKNISIRNFFISLLVILWLILFHYESVRYFYLNPFLSRFSIELPKTKFLFPPAGWIMFFNVEDSYGYVEVYGIKGMDIQLIDPHEIFRTRTILFDNVRRNILVSVADKETADDFCQFLQYRFSYFDRFLVTYTQHPSLTKEPLNRSQQILYACPQE